MRDTLARVMPSLLRHEGLWRGRYRHVDVEGGLLDEHDVEVRCEFPDEGPFAYIQHNHFSWPDGRDYRATLPGLLRDGRLWWDVDTFHGYSWEGGDGILLLNLTRKDEPGANFFEMITLGDSGLHRSRTWHWFRDGQLYKRTLCDEHRVEPL